MNNNFEISLVVFMPNITTNHAITYTNKNIINSDGYSHWWIVYLDLELIN